MIRNATSLVSKGLYTAVLTAACLLTASAALAQINPSPPALLNTNATSDSGVDWDPQIATDGAGNWVCVWYSTEDLNGAAWDADIFVARSWDNGAAWTAPALLNTNATSDSG